jgi:hypothetical protein
MNSNTLLNNPENPNIMISPPAIMKLPANSYTEKLAAAVLKKATAVMECAPQNSTTSAGH